MTCWSGRTGWWPTQGLQVTDDAAAVEALGYPVVLVAGDREALKVTEPLDLLFAEAIVRSHA